MKKLSNTKKDIFILGAGVTGLACGYNSGLTIIEKNNYSGGICSSYYLSKDKPSRLSIRREDQEDYRFEYGGGHWLFGDNEEVFNFISKFDSFKTYLRQSSVYLSTLEMFVPYPIQNNLRVLPNELVRTIISEIQRDRNRFSGATLYEWCEYYFGKTLSELFFHPFHELYTAGLWKDIEPQDGYKSPINLQQIIEGAKNEVHDAGGLSAITSKLESTCNIVFGKEITFIDLKKKMILFNDDSNQKYTTLISTLPLNVMQDLTGIGTLSKQDPFTSVLVLNIGARTGRKKIKDQWIYFPKSISGFHRVGFYSNVDNNFLPFSKRNGEYSSLYVERAFHGVKRPTESEILSYSKIAIDELRNLGFIDDIEVINPTWIDVAYTWSYPGSHWKEEMIAKLADHDIYCVGRYATWKFQGIMDSIKDGLKYGLSLKFS